MDSVIALFVDGDMLVTIVTIIVVPCLFVLLIHILFSPLQSIPGPWLLRTSKLWIWLKMIRFNLPDYILSLHRKFGPIVRVGPNEVSVNDFELFTKTIYTQSSPYLKNAAFYHTQSSSPSSPQNVFTTTNPKEHSLYRKSMSHQFSRKNILAIEGKLWNKTLDLCAIIEQKSQEVSLKDRKIDAGQMYRSLAFDLICEFSFGHADGALNRPGFDHPWVTCLGGVEWVNHIFVPFPWLKQVLLPMFPYIPMKAFDGFSTLTQGVSIKMIEHIREPENSYSTPTLFQSMKRAGIRQDHVFTDLEFIEAGSLMIFAGTDTTGGTLATGTRCIAASTSIQKRLRAELVNAWPDLEDAQPSLVALEQLPYLAACVKESLRYFTAASGRLPRIVPAGGLNFRGYHIPAGTLISSSIYLMHNDESIFPKADTFDPERWLVEDAHMRKRRDAQLLPFSSGARNCIGVNLAQAEIYIVIASVFRRFHVAPVGLKEVKINRLFSTSQPEGVWVEFKRLED